MIVSLPEPIEPEQLAERVRAAPARRRGDFQVLARPALPDADNVARESRATAS